MTSEKVNFETGFLRVWIVFSAIWVFLVFTLDQPFSDFATINKFGLASATSKLDYDEERVRNYLQVCRDANSSEVDCVSIAKYAFPETKGMSAEEAQKQIYKQKLILEVKDKVNAALENIGLFIRFLVLPPVVLLISLKMVRWILLGFKKPERSNA